MYGYLREIIFYLLLPLRLYYLRAKKTIPLNHYPLTQPQHLSIMFNYLLLESRLITFLIVIAVVFFVVSIRIGTPQQIQPMRMIAIQTKSLR
jgi:hypothetical protein